MCDCVWYLVTNVFEVHSLIDALLSLNDSFALERTRCKVKAEEEEDFGLSDLLEQGILKSCYPMHDGLCLDKVWKFHMQFAVDVLACCCIFEFDSPSSLIR